MRLLLVGFGRWGQNWTKTLHQLGILDGICEENPLLWEKVASLYPNTPLYKSFIQALEDSQALGVILATPVVAHPEMATHCLLSGRSVLVEKPMTLSAADAQKLVELAESHSRVLAVGHLLYYHPAMLALKNLVDDGVLGEILSIQCTRINLGTVRNEENAWWSLAPHDVSILKFLLNNQALQVQSAWSSPILNRETLPDQVGATFISEAGVSCKIEVSWLSPIKRHETLVIGKKAIAVFDDAQPEGQKLKLMKYHLEGDADQYGALTKGDWELVTYSQELSPLAGEAKAFAEAVARHAQGLATYLPNNGQNGLEVVELLEAVDRMILPTAVMSIR